MKLVSKIQCLRDDSKSMLFFQKLVVLKNFLNEYRYYNKFKTNSLSYIFQNKTSNIKTNSLKPKYHMIVKYALIRPYLVPGKLCAPVITLNYYAI